MRVITLNRKEFEIEWWKNWINGDALQRQELVEELPIIEDLTTLILDEDLDSADKHMIISSLLNGYFEDLYNEVTR